MEDFGQFVAFAIGIIILIINVITKANKKNAEVIINKKQNPPVVVNTQNINEEFFNYDDYNKLKQDEYKATTNYTTLESLSTESYSYENASLEEELFDARPYDLKMAENIDEEKKKFDFNAKEKEKSFFEVNISKIIVYSEIINRPNY